MNSEQAIRDDLKTVNQAIKKLEGQRTRLERALALVSEDFVEEGRGPRLATREQVEKKVRSHFSTQSSVKIDQGMLAEQLGVGRSTLNRVMKDLMNSGEIKNHGTKRKPDYRSTNSGRSTVVEVGRGVRQGRKVK